MTPANRLQRTVRPCLGGSLWTAALLLLAFSAAAPAAEAPAPLAAAASATPQLAVPKGEPQKLVVAPPAASAATQPAVGTTGGTAAPAAKASSAPGVARGEGKVAAGKPVVFSFTSQAGGMYSIGVSSPGNAARIAILLGTSDAPAVGTTAADGAIRWSSEIETGETVRILVYTAGKEIPFRVEANFGPGGL